MFVDVADLIFSRRCLACHQLGTVLCQGCWDQVSGHPRRIGQTWLPLAVGTEYEGIGRALVLAHKRSLQRSLVKPLGHLLAESLLVLSLPRSGCTLIPMPPHRSALRTRGQDTVAAITRRAIAHLNTKGWELRMQKALRFAHDPGSLAGLSRRERYLHMTGVFMAHPGRGAPCVLIDDVITTGATMRAASDALTKSEWNVLGGSAVAGVR